MGATQRFSRQGSMLPGVDSAARLWQIADAARTFLEPHWKKWHESWGPPAPSTASQWTCMRTAAFLAFALEHAGFAAKVATGRPRPKLDEMGCGFWANDGWQSHAWVVCGDHIVDITADQFGHPEIIIELTSGGRYRPGHDPESTLSLTENGALAVQELMKVWK